MSLPCTPLADNVVIFRAMFPTIDEVVDTCIEYGTRDGGGKGHVMKNMQFEASEHIGVGQHTKGVVFLPPHIPIEFFKFGQILGEICHSFVGLVESLYFSSK